MDKQLSLSALSDELSQVRTKKREFLAEIDHIVPWGKWLSIIKPYYYKGERSNKPYDLERMRRIYLVQNLWHQRTIRRRGGRCLFRHLRHADSSIYVQQTFEICICI